MFDGLESTTCVGKVSSGLTETRDNQLRNLSWPKVGDVVITQCVLVMPHPAQETVIKYLLLMKKERELACTQKTKGLKGRSKHSKRSIQMKMMF